MDDSEDNEKERRKKFIELGRSGWFIGTTANISGWPPRFRVLSEDEKATIQNYPNMSNDDIRASIRKLAEHSASYVGEEVHDLLDKNFSTIQSEIEDQVLEADAKDKLKDGYEAFEKLYEEAAEELGYKKQWDWAKTMIDEVNAVNKELFDKATHIVRGTDVKGLNAVLEAAEAGNGWTTSEKYSKQHTHASLDNGAGPYRNAEVQLIIPLPKDRTGYDPIPYRLVTPDKDIFGMESVKMGLGHAFMRENEVAIRAGTKPIPKMSVVIQKELDGSPEDNKRVYLSYFSNLSHK